jgi:hypothetical protein
MTMQIDDLAARRSEVGWTIAAVPEGGGARVHMLGEQGERLLSLDLATALPGYTRFVHWTTAGMFWSQNSLAYFTAGQRHFVVRAWWGERLVVALDRLHAIDPAALTDELRQTESHIVMESLRHIVARIAAGETPGYNDPSSDVLDCSICTLAHLPGLLGLIEAVPLLRVMEEWWGEASECWSSFRYYTPHYQRLAQNSLRQLGERPIGYPALTFTDEEERLSLRQPQPGPIDGPTRHTGLTHIRRETPLVEVYRLLGAPDDIDGDFWRYDVDVDPPYTVLLWLAENKSVSRMVRYYPPFWTGPHLFPCDDHSVLDADGTVRADHDNATFTGNRIELDVLHALADSGRYPLAPLAKAVLAGQLDAIPPLIDALEEANDPLAARVWGWLPKT